MPLVTNSQGRKLYVLRRISTQEVLNRFVVYPNALDDAPIVGLDPDLEYLPIDRDVVPDYDSRVYTLTTNEAKVGSLWRITYATNKKQAVEIKTAVRNREIAEISKHLPDEEFRKLVILNLATLFASIKGLNLTVEQSNARDRLLSIGVKLWENDAAVAQLDAVIDAGEVPDIESVWAVKG